MSKPTQISLIVLIGVLLICALPFLSRLSFGTHERVSPSPSVREAAMAVPTVSPTMEQTTNGAEQAERERLQAEGQPLKETSADLDQARRQAEADKKRADKNTQMMAELNAKLVDPNLKVPQTVSEAALLKGQNLADAARFQQKWGDSAPAAGTPEADEYAREQDALVTQSAALLKFLTDEKNSAPLAERDNLVQFQAASLAGALDLRDDQAQAVNTVLDGYYQQFYEQGLNTTARPETGFDAWRQQRLALSQQAYAAVAALLTPEQAAAFHNAYPHSGLYLFQMTFGGLPVTATF